MWNQFLSWIHHAFNPHCAVCIEQKFADKQCDSCDTLRYILEREKAEKLKLIEYITYREVEPEPVIRELPKPIQRARPWRHIAAELEANSRKESEARRIAAEESKEVASVSTIEELEQKAGVAENG